MKAITPQKPIQMFLALALIFLTTLGPWSTSPAKGLMGYQGEGSTGKIVFESRRDGNSEIYVMNADGSDQTRLTNNTSDDHEPDWSPDGQKIVFVCNNLEICIMNSDGSGLVQLTDDSFQETSPAWSPDGQKIAFGSKRTGRRDIYVIDVNSGELTRLTFDETWDGNPTWSPDGEQIAFEVSPPFEEAYYGTVIYIMSASGRDLRQLTYLPSGAYANHYSPAWSPDGTLIAFGAFFDGDNVSSGVYRIGTDGHPLSLTQLTQNSDYYLSPAWSPDGQQIAFDANGDIYTINLSNDEQRQITNTPDQDTSPDWTSGQILPSLEELIARKEAVIPGLETTTYTYAYNFAEMPIKAYDEKSARDLIAKLRQVESSTISPEQVTAFSRLVMQEETLKETLDDYSVVSNYEADTLTDLSGLFWGTVFFAGQAKVSWLQALRDVALKAFRDTVILYTGLIDDDATRASVRNSLYLVFDTITARTDNGETYFQVVFDSGLREIVANANMRLLANRVQPTLDKGVRSVYGSEQDIWTVEGTDESAKIQLSIITDTSDSRRNDATSWYVGLEKGREANEILKDLADLMTAGSGGVPITRFFSFWTRFQQLLIDFVAHNIVTKAMTCIAQVSERAGELAFQPQQQIALCDSHQSKVASYQAALSNGPYGDSIAWQTFRPELQTDLANYKAAIEALRTAMQSGDKTQVEQAAEQLAAAQAEVNESTTIAMNLIMPPTGEVWTPETEAMAQQIVNLDFNAIGLQIGIGGYLSDPTSQEAKDYVNQYAQDLLDNTTQVEQSLPLTESFGSNNTAVPVIVSAPAELEGVVGQPLSFNVKILNAGSATLAGAILTTSGQDTVLASVDTSAIEANQSAELTVSFTPSAEGQTMILLTVDDGQRTDFRFVQLTVKSAPPTLVPTSTPPRSTPLSAPCSCLPAAALLPLVVVMRKRKKKVSR